MEIMDEIAPAVTVEDFLAATHMPEGDAADRFAIEMALSAAEAMVTTATGRPLSERTCRFELPAGWATWSVPVLPVSSVEMVEAQDVLGEWVELSAVAVLRDAYSAPVVELVPVNASRLRITVKAGYVENPLPQLRQAVILLAKEWFEAGIAVEDQGKLELSFGALRLIKQVRYRPAAQFGWVG